MGNNSSVNENNIINSPKTICPNCVSKIPKLLLFVINSKAYLDIICECSPQKIQSMSLNSFLLFIKQNSPIKIKNNFYCGKHNKKYKGYCNFCQENICKICLLEEHGAHSYFLFKEKNIEINIKSIIDRKDALFIRIMQANQVIRMDFIETINTMHPNLGKYIKEIEQKFCVNLTINSEVSDLVQIILNTYELCIKNKLGNYNIFFNLFQNTKFNTRLLDAAEEDYETRIHTLLKYFNNNFLVVPFHQSFNFKVINCSKLLQEKEEILDQCCIDKNLVCFLLNNSKIKIIDITEQKVIKEIQYTEDNPQIHSYGFITVLSNNCAIIGHFNSQLYCYSISDWKLINKTDFLDWNLFNILSKIDKEFIKYLPCNSWKLNENIIFTKISDENILLYQNDKKQCLIYNIDKKETIFEVTYPFSILSILIVQEKEILLFSSINTAIAINIETFQEIKTVSLNISKLESSYILKENIVILTIEDSVTFYDIKTSQCLQTIKKLNLRGKNISQLEDGRIIISSSKDIIMLDNIINFTQI